MRLYAPKGERIEPDWQGKLVPRDATPLEALLDGLGVVLGTAFSTVFWGISVVAVIILSGSIAFGIALTVFLLLNLVLSPVGVELGDRLVRYLLYGLWLCVSAGTALYMLAELGKRAHERYFWKEHAERLMQVEAIQQGRERAKEERAEAKRADLSGFREDRLRSLVGKPLSFVIGFQLMFEINHSSLLVLCGTVPALLLL